MGDRLRRQTNGKPYLKAPKMLQCVARPRLARLEFGRNVYCDGFGLFPILKA